MSVRVRTRVVRNDLPRIIAALPGAVDEATDDTVRSMDAALTSSGWRDTGVVISTSLAKTEGRPGHSEWQVGEKRGRGFYVTFLEFGTSKMAARPKVQPIAHAHEPVLVTITTAKLREVCR